MGIRCTVKPRTRKMDVCFIETLLLALRSCYCCFFCCDALFLERCYCFSVGFFFLGYYSYFRKREMKVRFDAFPEALEGD